MSWFHSRPSRNPRAPRPAVRRPLPFRPLLEELEKRVVLTRFATPTYVLYHPLHGSSAADFVRPAATGYVPDQIRHAYGFDQIKFQNGAVQGIGSGQTIAIVDAYDDPNITSDLKAFDQYFGLPNPVFTKVAQDGSSNYPTADAGWAMEITLDVEWAHAMAPGAHILLVESQDSSYTNLLAAVDYAAIQPGVAVVSMSWGGGEFSSEASLDSHFTTPNGHTGVTFVASSGDSGAPVSYPAVSPNVLAVGGTSLNLDAQGNYSSESGWSGSGGGIGQFEAQPGYQQGVVPQTSTQRTNPDVAYDADPSTGFWVYDTFSNSGFGGWSQVGGTSAGAPQWASLIAIADQGRKLAGESSLDGATQTLAMLYGLPATDFSDVTSGTSTGSPNYSAGAGYDLVTGRGTPHADQVVAGLVGQQSQQGVNLIGGFPGIGATGFEPPDTDMAVGPNQVVETVNTSLQIYDKAGNTLFAQSLNTFFGSGTDFLSDPRVVYNDATGRFLVVVEEFNAADPGAATQSYLDYAISNSSDPTAGFSTYQLNTTEFDASLGTLLNDYPTLGWNADGFVVTQNMFSAPLDSGSFAHVQIVSIDNAGNAFINDRADGQDFSLSPARMHDASAGGPMWFAESQGGNSLRLVEMTNVFSQSPTFTDTTLSVPSYTDASQTPPTQPDGTAITSQIDSRILDVARRGNELVAAQNVSDGSETQARWYAIDLTDPINPSLLGAGNVNAGAGVATYMPAIDIAPDGSLGLSYLESSATEYMSMYVTGRQASDAAGALETPVLVQAGEANFGGGRAGDMSGVGIDPTDGSFWAANEYASASGDWGTAVAHFSISAAQGNLAAPTPIGPSGTVAGTTPTFSWDAVSGADHYHVTVTDQNTGQVTEDANVAATSWVPGQPLTAGDSYQWQVRAVAADGTTGLWSGPLAFTVQSRQLPAPTLIGPSGTMTGATPTFSWNAVDGADHYDIYVSDQDTGQVIRDRFVAGTSWTPNQALTPGASYVWWARAFAADGTAGPWSSSLAFSVQQLSVPTPIAPAGAVTGATQTFTWSAVTGADHYDIWVDDLRTGQSQVLRNRNAAGTSWAPSASLVQGDGYKWWVRAVGSDGSASRWSAGQSFTVAALGVPTPIGPAGHITSAQPTFNWTAVDQADHYDIWVDDLSTGQSQVLRDTLVTDASWTPPTGLVQGDSYEWWVRAIGSSGSRSQWSAGQSFSITALGVPTVTAPLGAASAQPTFSWTAVDQADHYDVWVDDVTAGQSQVLRNGNVAGTSWTAPVSLTQGHTYEVWVRAISSTGGRSAWSAPVEFVVGFNGMISE
jgi:hypothetical protein